MTAEELIKTIEGNAMERLRWRVLSEFGILPGFEAAAGLSDEDLLICGVHMLLDARGRLEKVGSGEAASNEAFDEERFLRLSEDADE